MHVPTAAASIASVLKEWGLSTDVGQGVTFPCGGAPLVATCLLYDVLGDSVMEWLGDSNRYGRHCVVQIWEDTSYPAKDAFAVARTVSKAYRYAVLFLFGRTEQQGHSIETNAGIQSLLFHTMTGTSSRVHFHRGHDAGVQLELGELGDVIV